MDIELTTINIDELPTSESVHSLEQGEKDDIKDRDFSNKPRTRIFIFGSILFTCISVLIAILIVCFTARKPKYSCETDFQIILDANSAPHNSHPRSLITDDFNHDHFLDIVVVNAGTNTIGIFINYGNGTFAPQITFTTDDNSEPVSLVCGHFNNDTHLDIVVTNYETHNIGIFLGYGNGSFTNQRTFFTRSSRPLSIDVGYLNNDSFLDVVFTNIGTNDICIAFGDGNGYFRNEVFYSTGYDSLPYSVVVDDLNNDHYLDIVVLNSGTNNIGIFFGNGNGSFTKQKTYSTNPQSNPYAIGINDFNNDRYLDIAVIDYGTNHVGIFLANGNGSFTTQTLYSLSSGLHPSSLVIADINQDDQLDIAICNYASNNISILIGIGDGHFESPTIHSTGSDSQPYGIIAGDFDNDNQSDIAVVNSGTNNMMIMIGYSFIQAETPTLYSSGEGSLPYQILSDDLNNDNVFDLVVLNYGTNNVGIFLGNGNGSFKEQMPYSTGTDSHPYGFSISDIDKDSHLDIIVATSNSESVGILYGYGNGTFEIVVKYFVKAVSSPRWVCVADLNKDNHLDIIYADYGLNVIGISFGYGNRLFSNLTKYSTGDNSHPYAVLAADVNNDNHFDIVVANFGTNNVMIFVGSGDGNVALFGTYSTGPNSLPYMLAVGDLNKDNKLDIVVPNSGTSNVGIFFGNGNGSFSAQVTYSTGSNTSPYWVSIADLNNDSWFDIVAANINTNNVGVFLGNNNGYFTNQTSYSTGPASSPYSIAVRDFNHDGRLDIAVANYGSKTVGILLGHQPKDSAHSSSISGSTPVVANQTSNNVPILLGDYYANFRSQTSYSTGSSSFPYSIAIGDLNNDTRMDIVIANSGNENLGLLFGYGNGSYASQITYPLGITSNPQKVIIHDFNNDNYLDVAVTDFRNDNIRILLGSGNGTFERDLTYSTGIGSNPSALAVGNFNNDKYLDLVVTNKGTDTIGVFFGFDYTFFTKQKICQLDASSTGPYGTAVGDFNHDGYLDIVFVLFTSNNVGVVLGYGNGSFSPMVSYSNVPSSHPWSLVLGDFNNDTHLDILTATWGIDGVGVLLGHGNGSFSEPLLLKTGSDSRPTSVAVGDLNNDKRLDIAAANYGGNSISIFFGNGNGTFMNMTVLSAGQGSRPTNVIVSDLNNDTHADLVITSEGFNCVIIFLGVSNGRFAGPMQFSSGASSTPATLLAGDFNRDGVLDLVTANYGSSNVGILFGYGNGSFANVQLYSTGFGTYPVNVDIGDFNNDNILDIAVSTNIVDYISILFGYSDGTFASASAVPIGHLSIANFVSVGDFNSDKHLDFIISDFGLNNIGVFLANGSKPFGGQSTFSSGTGSHPSSVAVDDFNNDNHDDIVFTNSATNNISILFGYGDRTFSDVVRYSIGKNNSNPSSLATADFNNDSFSDIVIAASASNSIVILMGSGQGNFSTPKIYSIGDGFRPVSVAVGYFDRNDELDIAIANAGANNMCVLFGEGDGRFVGKTCYPMDYDSRPNFVIFADVNNDGWEDVGVATYGIDNVKIRLNLC